MKATRDHQSNALDAKSKRTETSSASHDSAVKITQRGDVWTVISHRAIHAEPNLTFPKKHPTFAKHVYSRHANAVHNDLEVKHIAVPIKKADLDLHQMPARVVFAR